MKFNKKYFLGGIILIHVILVFLSMNQPFHGDEVLFSEAALGILKTGKPITDYGVNMPNFQALWHIPTYIYMIAGSIALFGDNIYSVRLISAIFNLLTIILVYLITKEILNKNKNKENWALLAAFIYALNPLTIQSSILLDIDRPLNFAMYLFLYLFIKKKSFFYLIPTLIFVFLLKEFGLPILFLTLMGFYIITKNFKKIPKILGLFFISGILGIGLWWIFAAIMNLNFIAPLAFNFGLVFNFTKVAGESALSPIVLLSRAWMFKSFFYFAVPFFVTLFFYLTSLFYLKIWKHKKLLKQEETKRILLFNLLSLFVILAYLVMGGTAWGFPKYHIIAVPGMSIFIAYILSKSNVMLYVQKIWEKKKWILVILSVVLLIYFLSFVKDPLIPEFDSTKNNTNLNEAIFLVLKSFVLYAIIPFGICLSAFSLVKIKKKIWICLIYLSIFMFLYINILHTTVDYSTYAKYGDIGIPEVIKYFKENNIPPSEIATHVHLGSYLGMSDYYEITSSYDSPKKFKKEVINNADINYIVIWERDIGRIGENMKSFKLEEKIGTYYIFKKKI